MAASARPQEPAPELHCVRHDATTDLAVVRPE
jgi:hypothetical protein